ncbi:MAG: hypothetical protein PUP91_37555, partial [Rhizonema sp. PD37]|nr:hypothetical protein [Rhizonema sp. PD37]
MKERYLLSEGWIKKIGEPDKYAEGLYGKVAHLYSRKRVDSFLTENAQTYAAWLIKRDKYLEIFENKREEI